MLMWWKMIMVVISIVMSVIIRMCIRYKFCILGCIVMVVNSIMSNGNHH